MNPFANIFDAELVQLKTRRTVLNLTASIVSTLIVVGVVAYAAKISSDVSPYVAGALVLGSIAYVIWALDRLQRARRVAWCLKVSDETIVGYDFSRERHVIQWRDVESIDVSESALEIHSKRRSPLIIPHLYKEYGALGRCLLDYTEAYGIPLSVNGTPLLDINIYNLFPGLGEISRAA